MNSCGLNTSLAKDLLEKGKRDVVLENFWLCRTLRRADMGKLDDWSRDVRAGGMPSFGPNVDY